MRELLATRLNKCRTLIDAMVAAGYGVLEVPILHRSARRGCGPRKWPFLRALLLGPTHFGFCAIEDV